MSEEGVRILVSIAAVTATSILAVAAVMQWRTARQKLALDLYDRRIEYYRRARSFIMDIANRSDNSYTALISFAKDTDEARFFFGHDVRLFLDRLYFHVLKATSLNEQLYPRSGLRGLPPGSEREAVSTRFSAEILWLTEHSKEADVVFAPYLFLGAATVPAWPGFKNRERRRVKESWERAKAEVNRESKV